MLVLMTFELIFSLISGQAQCGGGRRVGGGTGWEGWEEDKTHAIVHP